MALSKDDQMDIDTPEKGTYQLREEQQQQQGNGSGDCKDKDKGEKEKQKALYEKCCRDLERAYATVNRELREKVSEFCSLQKYYRQNELMPRELFNFYNAITTNKHEFLMLEKALVGLKRLEGVLQETMFGPKPAEVGEHAHVDWAENMPCDNPEVNPKWSVW